MGTVNAARTQPEARPMDALGVALLIAGAAALVLRRRYPSGVLAVAPYTSWTPTPSRPRSALVTIKQSSGQLLREMRATLGVLRGVDDAPPRHPVAGLARLADLLEENRSAGLPVELEVSGSPRELPASVDHAAYRIVQEALTNTRRHAGPANARVALRQLEGPVGASVYRTGQEGARRGGVDNLGFMMLFRASTASPRSGLTVTGAGRDRSPRRSALLLPYGVGETLPAAMNRVGRRRNRH